jgi:ribosomal protein S18 acetylase RimI-like enzyme
MSEPKQLTWIADLSDVLRHDRGIPDGYVVRAMEAGDRDRLATLYLETYPREVVADEAAAIDEMERTFRGEYGNLDFQASPVAFHRGAVAASVMTVVDAPWEDTPPGPFLIEVMVDPAHRKRGLAECLICAAARELLRQGGRTVALRVMSDNLGALRLYGKLGFTDWDPVNR